MRLPPAGPHRRPVRALIVEATSTPSLSVTRIVRSTSSAWDLLVALTARDLKVTYQGTVLSFVWWIARPLAMGLVLYFALGRVLRLDIPHYGVFLMSGLFPWFWFSGAIQGAASSLVANGGLLKKVQFPRLVLPLSVIFFNTVQFLLTLPVLAIFVLVSGIDPSPAWLAGIPILLALQLLLLIGLGSLLASLNVFFRDLGPMLDVALLLMFYATPIIYPIERVPGRFKALMMINPAAPLMEAWRELFVQGRFPDADLWPSIAFAAASLVIGIGAFRKLEKYYADAL